MTSLQEIADRINADTQHKNALFVGLVRHLAYGDDPTLGTEEAVEQLHASGHTFDQLQTVLSALVQRDEMQRELDSLDGCEAEASALVEKEKLLMLSFDQQQDQRRAAIDAATEALLEIKVKVDRVGVLKETLPQLAVFE